MLMKLKNAAKFIIILVIFFFNAVSFAEELNKVKDTADAVAVFEQALRNHETKKQRDQEDFAAKLNDSLSQQINLWVDSARKDKDGKIGTFFEQNWEKLPSPFKIPAGHYEYYLRGYKYTVVKSDIVRTESLMTAYKAEAVIKEDLYVEKYHSPDVSDINLYFYTVSTNYHLNFEYKQNKFVLVNSDSKIVGFLNDCPVEIKKPST